MTHVFAPIVNSEDQWRTEMDRLSQSNSPTFFSIRTKLPKKGRTNQILGASKSMNVVLKTYASGGENELHAHSNEDHVFVVLQGGATFYGPRDERREVTKHDCVLIPAGAFYRFQAKEDEPLVLLRVGATLNPEQDVLARIDIDGEPFGGYTKKQRNSVRAI
ncbi:MAG: cupin domain-containing protein [Burkholderiaceae bacterium]|nr:cupin domain-containing protein [Burkholderiaceae bacterium]